MTFKGVDVSKWQPSIDWEKVKTSGITFAIIRASYSKSTDRKFDAHIKGALKVGIKVGVYCYTEAKTPQRAIEEADHILKLIEPYEISYPICFDIESSNLHKLSNQERTDIVIAFCERIENAGYYAMIYSNKNWLENLLDYNRLRQYDIWLAQWTKKPNWSGKYGIWQYGQAQVDGIGECDCNVSYKDYPQIIEKANLNNLGIKVVKVGSRVKYSGVVYYSSWGVGRRITRNGIFTVKKVIKNRKYGIQIDKLGWVSEYDCIVV